MESKLEPPQRAELESQLLGEVRPDWNLVMHLPLESRTWFPRRSPNAT
jgi:hypothetical protein